MKNYFLLFLLGAFSVPVFAQKDSIHLLDKVVLQGSTLKEFSNTQHVRVLNDSVVKNAASSLTDILKYHTPIYFKENGLGMVSSVSFRGTTASQTAVVWNGININSKFNGQTDFNALNIGGYDAISVRSGGGGVLYGSGAIGGSVHLKNKIQFGKGGDHALKLGYGSFNTLDARYGYSYSNKKISAGINVARTSSDNDYPYVDSERENLNGAYYNTSGKAHFAYKINQNNSLKFHTSWYDGERHFSLIRPSENHTKYHDFHTWNLLAWESNFNRFSSNLKLAYLKEKYAYYPNIQDAYHTHGKAETFLGNYNIGYTFAHAIELHGLFDYSYTKGEGTSIPENYQKVGAAALLMKHRVSDVFLYEIGAKKEFTENYKSPFLFSAGIDFNAGNRYSIKVNYSKNYRIPTFNDMYWQDSGSTNLKPETSQQAEIGNYFHWKNIDFSVTAYLIDIQDMIRWVPTGSVWKPVNTSKVQTYGVESNFNYQQHFQAHKISVHASYGYTVSENKQTGKQLIYVPFHKATTTLGYGYKSWSFTYNFLYNGTVFTRTDNAAGATIPAYQVSNLGIAYSFLLKKNNHIKIGAKALNIFNEKYQSVEKRFLPGRNYSMYLILKF